MTERKTSHSKNQTSRVKKKTAHLKTHPSSARKPQSSRPKTPISFFASHKVAIISFFLTVIIVITSIVLQTTQHSRVTLTSYYYTSLPTAYDLSTSAYEQLISARESFVVMVDNPGCVTTARMREYLADFQDELPLSYYRFMWSDVKESSLKNTVEYFPSLVIIDHGRPVYHLRADSDEDAPYYNDADALKSWLEQHIDFSTKRTI